MNKDYCNKIGQWLWVGLLLLFVTACSHNTVVPVAEHTMLKARFGHAAVRMEKGSLFSLVLINQDCCLMLKFMIQPLGKLNTGKKS
ncbi:hypothetical protein [Rheinheimera sp. KL1]|uniref:hypothetical protein n=1 Tax=Rheinheimera sp. KL1 TaxID=1635005 RepID=UPI000B0B7844|nr:hypothetical protein [Rheinheimera sp. KL1]